MSEDSIYKIQRLLYALLGINFSISYDLKMESLLGTATQQVDPNMIVILRPEKLDKPNGFCIIFSFFWKRYLISYVQDNFAYKLAYDMGKNIEGHNVFEKIANTIVSGSTKLIMSINGDKMNPLDSESWVDDWNKLELSLERYSEDLDSSIIENVEDEIIGWGSKFISLLMTLVPVETELSDVPEQEMIHYPEGSKERIEVNRYERDTRNRAACISFHGYTCKACGFNFQEMYGEIGAGFIHVHHKIPVSEMGEDYMVNPIEDLVPVCANCHAMLHRKEPAYTIQELREILEKQKNSF